MLPQRGSRFLGSKGWRIVEFLVCVDFAANLVPAEARHQFRRTLIIPLHTSNVWKRVSFYKQEPPGWRMRTKGDFPLCGQTGFCFAIQEHYFQGNMLFDMFTWKSLLNGANDS
jgi:hypothetical protein